MRIILLSFKPQWFNKIISGEKIFEYRNAFADNEVLAYMYVSSPVKQIVGMIYLGKRIKLLDLAKQYKDNLAVLGRVNHYKEKYRYVMPILSVQMTRPITLENLRAFDKNFVCPQMYYYLDSREELFKYIKTNALPVCEPLLHSFNNLHENEICKIYITSED